MEFIMQKIAAVILTKNEEKNIQAVIENARKSVDEIIVIDSGSTDRTVEFAQKCCAKVFFRQWDHDFSAQRNFALDKTDADYVLYLDADERMSDELCQEVKKIAADGELKQYSFMRKINAFGFEYKYGVFIPDEVIRVFPREYVHWENKVHERPVCQLPKVQLHGFADHYTFNSLQQWLDKAGKYTTIWAQDNYSRGKRVGVSAAFLHGIYGFIRVYFIQLGFLDGWGGMYSSCLHSFYTMLKYWKLYESNDS